MMDELVAWLREQLTAVLDEIDSAVSELEGWTCIGYTSADDILKLWPRAEVEAKLARITLLADLASKCPEDDWPEEGGMELAPMSDLARHLLKLEAQPLSARPGFKDEWRLT